MKYTSFEPLVTNSQHRDDMISDDMQEIRAFIIVATLDITHREISSNAMDHIMEIIQEDITE